MHVAQMRGDADDASCKAHDARDADELQNHDSNMKSSCTVTLEKLQLRSTW